MKTLNYNKGSLTLIFTEQGQLLFRCEPYLLLESSFIMLPSLTFFQDYLNGHVQCDTYNLPLYLCDMIILNCGNHKSFMESNSFKNFIRKQLGMSHSYFVLLFCFVFSSLFCLTYTFKYCFTKFNCNTSMCKFFQEFFFFFLL